MGDDNNKVYCYTSGGKFKISVNTDFGVTDKTTIRGILSELIEKTNKEHEFKGRKKKITIVKYRKVVYYLA